MFMKKLALLSLVTSQTCISFVEVTYKRKHPHNTKMFGYVKMGSKKHLCQVKGIIISKVIIILIIINMPFDTENTKPKRELQNETISLLN